MNLKIEATYSDGVLVPQSALNLSEDLVYQVHIVSVVKPKTKRKSLFGAFPQLAALADDTENVKDLWKNSIDKQLHILQSKDN